MDKETAKAIRHAIAEEMAAAGLEWGGRQDYAAGVALQRVSLHTTPKAAQAPLEGTQLERALIELDEVRTALEKQSTAHTELRAAYDQRGKAIEAANKAANRFNKALWEAVERLGEGEVKQAEDIIGYSDLMVEKSLGT